MFNINLPFTKAFAFCILIILNALVIDCVAHKVRIIPWTPVPIFQKVCTGYPNGIKVCNCRYGPDKWAACN